MKHLARLAAIGVVLLTTGCTTAAPTSDTTDPDVNVIVGGVRDNIFRSRDGELLPPRNCINVPGPPWQLILIAGDSGGVRAASIKVSGTIDPATVEVTPPAPEGTFSIRTDRGFDTLVITLSGPAPGTVRTGATAIIQVDGALPLAVTADAVDYAGNLTVLSGFDLRSPGGVHCRGDQ